MGWQEILKSYDLNEFIIRKEKPKKGAKKEKGSKEFKVKVPGGTLTVVQTARIVQLQADFKKWWTTCESLKLESIGIVGEKGNTSLLEFVLDHVDQRVQRPRQEPKKGAMKITQDIMDIVEEKGIYTKSDLKTVQDFITMLEAVKTNSRSNPKNILFTEQRSKKKKVTVRGHYRTPWYAKKTGKTAVDSGWYDYEAGPGKKNDKSTAEPPMWQALFNGDAMIQKTTITGLEKGLLTLLIEFEDEMKNQPIHDIPVFGKAGREAVLKIKGVIQGLSNILANQESYHSLTEPYKRLWVNVTNVRRQLNDFEFSIDPNDTTAMEAIKRLTGHEEWASENLAGFKIVQITPGLLRSLIRTMGIDLDTFRHGTLKGMFLHRPWTTKVETTRKKLLENEYKYAKSKNTLPHWARKDEDKDTPVKKSWMGILKKVNTDIEKDMMPMRDIRPPQNPAADLHMPRIFNKDKQTQVSNNKNESCDYCEKDVVLDCRECNQKLCYDHLDKPCAIKKSNIIEKKKNKNFGGQSYSGDIPHGTQMSGGEINAQELRRLIQEINDDKDEDDEEEKEFILITIPIHYEGGEREIRTGLFNYNGAKRFFGSAYLENLIENSSGIMGAYFVTKEDLVDSPIKYPNINDWMILTESKLMDIAANMED